MTHVAIWELRRAVRYNLIQKFSGGAKSNKPTTKQSPKSITSYLTGRVIFIGCACRWKRTLED